MGRPRLNRVLPKYASEFIDRHGKARIRLRRTGFGTIYVQAKPGTPEFTEAYCQWLAGCTKALGESSIAPGTFDDLIVRFYKSPAWNDLKASTRETYRGELERFRTAYGSRAVATMTARNVSNLMARMQNTPAAANNLKKRLGQLFNHAILLGMRKDNPAKAVRGLKARTGGFATWQEEQIEQYEAQHPIGTMPRLAFDLALYTAQRKSDVRLMGPPYFIGAASPSPPNATSGITLSAVSAQSWTFANRRLFTVQMSKSARVIPTSSATSPGPLSPWAAGPVSGRSGLLVGPGAAWRRTRLRMA